MKYGTKYRNTAVCRINDIKIYKKKLEDELRRPSTWMPLPRPAVTLTFERWCPESNHVISRTSGFSLWNWDYSSRSWDIVVTRSVRTNERTNYKTNKRMNEWTNERMDECGGRTAGNLCFRRHCRVSKVYKNSSGDEIANVNFLTTISHTRGPTSKYRKRDKPTLFNKLDDR